MDEQKQGKIDGWKEGKKVRQTIGKWTDKQTDERKGGHTDTWKESQTEREREINR